MLDRVRSLFSLSGGQVAILAIDQGTTSTRAMLFRADTSVPALPRASSRSTFPAERRGRARAGGFVGDDRRNMPQCAAPTLQRGDALAQRLARPILVQ
jgi:glycerol kinase